MKTAKLLPLFFPSSRAEIGNVDKYVQMALLFETTFSIFTVTD
jgi:hypothetical protein